MEEEVMEEEGMEKDEERGWRRRGWRRRRQRESGRSPESMVRGWEPGILVLAPTRGLAGGGTNFRVGPLVGAEGLLYFGKRFFLRSSGAQKDEKW